MKEESQNPRIDPELETRIVALVLGEASDFERDELNRLIKERPELATLKEQIQSMHGLLRDVVTGESVAEDDDWKLSAEKRSAVLAVIGGEAEEQSAKQVVRKFAEKRRSVKAHFFRNLTKIAAVFCVAGFFGSMAMLAFFNYHSNDSVRQLASNEAYTSDLKAGSELAFGKATAPPSDNFIMDGAKTFAADEKHFRTAEPAAVAEVIAAFDYEKNSESALSSIRDTLGYYANLSLPTKDGGPSVTFDLDGDGLPTADLNIRFDNGRFGSAAPTFGGFDAGSDSQEGLNGPEPPPRQTVDSPALFVNDKADWSGGLDRKGYRPTDSQPTVQKAAIGELSLPTFAFTTENTTVSVPDRGTILRGGIKRLAEGRGERGVPGEPAVSSPMTLRVYDESKIGGETQDAASKRMAILDFVDRPVLEGESQSSGIAALDELNKNRYTAVQPWGSQESGKGQKLSQELSLQLGGAGLKHSNVLEDSLAAGEDKDIDGNVADGKSMFGGGGGGGFGIDVTAPADERKKEISAEDKPEDIAHREKGSLQFTGETDVDTGRVANSQSGPTNKPMASREYFDRTGRLAVIEGYKENFAKEGVIVPSDDDIAVPKSRDLDRDVLYGEPVTGTSIGKGKSVRELKAAQANQDVRWGDAQNSTSDSRRRAKEEETNQPATITKGVGPHEIEERAKSSLGEISALYELYKNADIAGRLLPDDNGNNDDNYWAIPQSGLIDERDELLRRRGQLAIAGKSHWYGYALEDDSEPLMKSAVNKSAVPAGLNETSAEDEAFSTFSLHVSDVSFKLARAALAHGEWPEAAKVRIEEFVNAFDYGDPMPSQSEKVSCRLEQSIHPFLQQRNLLRVSMRTAAAGRSSSTPLRLTFLLDNSGSMERIDRQQTVRRAFALLAQQLKPIDQVTLISFARQPRLLADKVNGAQSRQLVQLIHDLPSEGGTNFEAALQLAFEKAREQQVDDAQNRIILLTDGAVNLGDANPESLSRTITTMRDAGIAFDAAGISAEGLNDEILEALTRKGDGRYYLLDFPEAVDDGFARQIAGALRPSAKNVKVQIEFNPKRVGRYKLLGFEKHRLKQEDFRNDKVDAAEMAAAEAGVAMYQFESKPAGEGDVGSVSVRFRDLSTGQMIENRWPIPYEADAPRPDQAAPSLRIAISAALLAAKLRGEALGESVDLKALSNLIAGLPDRDRNANRVQQLQLMIQQARQVIGN